MIPVMQERETVEQSDPDWERDLEQVTKKNAVPLKRTKAQEAALARRVAREALEAEQAAASAAAQARAQRLAQVANLFIAGHDLESIGAAIGASADEVDRMLQEDMARYVRNQPALRVFVRNFISARYTGLLDAVWDEATDKNHKEKLEHQDRALRILDRMAKLHGAEAPTQAEIQVSAAPEAVDKMVQAIASAAGLGYDTSIFDVVPGEMVHNAAIEAHDAEVVSGNSVSVPEDEDESWGPDADDTE
jgi:hypothetical protein